MGEPELRGGVLLLRHRAGAVRDDMGDAVLRGVGADRLPVVYDLASRPSDGTDRPRPTGLPRSGLPRGAALLGVPRRGAARVDRVQRRLELPGAADRGPGWRRVPDRRGNGARRL